MKKLICLLLALMIALPMSLAFAEDEIVITCRNIGATSTNDNLICEAIKEATGLNVTFDLRSSENYTEQCQLILAGGDYPDALEFAETVYPTDLQELADDGAIVALDEYLEEYGQEILATRNDPSMWFRSETDGKTYGIPTRVFEYGNNNVVVIRQDWLDKLGLPLPSSTEELMNTMKIFNENAELLVGDPNAKILYGTFSAGGWNTHRGCLLSIIGSENGLVSNDWNVVGDQMVYYINMPGYKDTLLAARQLYQDGLLEPEFELINREQFLEKLYQNQYGVWDWYFDQIDGKLGSMIAQLYAIDPECKLSVVFPFENEEGVRRSCAASWTRNLVIFNEEKAADIVKLMNYLVSEEGSLLVELGIEGKHWEYDADGNPTIICEMDTPTKEEMGYWQYNWLCKRTYLNPAAEARVKEMADINSGICVANPVKTVTETAKTSASILLDIVNRYEAELICTADIDFDASFDAFLKEWNSVGGAKWSEEMTAEYQKLK